MFYHPVTTIAILASLTARALATPMTRNSPSNALATRQIAEECTFAIAADDDPDPQASKIYIWNDKGVGQFLDNWLIANGEVDWSRRMDEDVMLGDAEGHSDYICDDIGNCPEPRDCMDYYNMGDDIWKFYYIQKAVYSFNQFFQTLYYALMESTIESTLAIDSMVDTFGPDPEGDDINAYAVSAAALGVAAGFAAGAPPVAALIAVIGGIMSMSGELAGEEDPVDYEQVASVQLGQAFSALTDSIHNILQLGGSGESDHGDTTAALPGQTGEWGTATSGFYDGGRWLLYDPVENAGKIGTALNNTVRQGMVTAILRKDLHYVFIDTGRQEEDCNTVGSVWMPQYEGCVSLWKEAMDGERSPLGYGAGNGMTEDKYNAMTGELGGYHNLEVTYANAIECAMAYGESNHPVSGDPSSYAFDGSYPECYFNYPVFKGWAYWKGVYQCWEMHKAGDVKIDTVPWKD